MEFPVDSYDVSSSVVQYIIVMPDSINTSKHKHSCGQLGENFMWTLDSLWWPHPKVRPSITAKLHTKNNTPAIQTEVSMKAAITQAALSVKLFAC